MLSHRQMPTRTVINVTLRPKVRICWSILLTPAEIRCLFPSPSAAWLDELGVVDRTAFCQGAFLEFSSDR
jgi:hypothetical protein